MKRIIVLCSALALCSVAAARTQELTYFSRPVEARVVKGMPYSAEIVTESIQTLADGNRIVRRTAGRVYRDFEGRVRREEDRPSGAPTVSISDPVARTSWTLDAANRTARATPGGVFVAAPDTTWLRIDGLTAVRGALAQLSGEVSVQSRGGGGRGGGDVTEEKLADRMIEGVLASGIRRTTTIAKGAIGNEQPIKIVSEEWTSPDLQILVLTDLNDPRTGRSTYRLLKISRLDPDPALFQVPADYTVQSGRARGAAPTAVPAGGGPGGRGRGGRG